jgi:hypothetical protein
MSGAVEQEIQAAAGWLRAEAARVPFGEIGVRLFLHNGTVARTERMTSEKRLPENGSDHARGS